MTEVEMKREEEEKTFFFSLFLITVHVTPIKKGDSYEGKICMFLRYRQRKRARRGKLNFV
jgi:hypothetical protein